MSDEEHFSPTSCLLLGCGVAFVALVVFALGLALGFGLAR